MKNLKKILSYAMMLIMVIFLFLGVNFKKVLADEELEFETNNGTISYEIDNNEVIITHYSGEDTNLEIPSEIDGKSVTTIGKHVFRDCDSLTSITIPDSITSIEESAFSDCDNLIIYGYKASYAETYANKEFIQFRDINNQTLNIENLKVNDDTSPQKVETTKTSNSNITIIVIISIGTGISIIILLWILLITRK